MTDTILFRVEGGLAWITLNRPEARNAINDEMRQALLDALARVAADPVSRAAVLTGAGEGFCPGADLWGGRRDAAPPPHAGTTRTLMKQNSQRLIRAVLELEKPLVAAVNGVAAGMGAHLALACDLVVMAAEARLVEVFARRGIAIDSAGAFLLSRLVGLLKAQEVIKIEQPPDGDYLRVIGGRKLAGLNLMHLRWNRGKKSVTLDLKRAEGQHLLHRLAATADVFIDGLRQGAAARCAADYEHLRAVNPRLVYCTLSGAGTSGPYAALATHGVAYDAFAGLASPVTNADGSPRIPSYTPVGMLAAPLHAALAVCAALVRARATGRGRLPEVAELDMAAAWQAEHLDATLNGVASAIPDMIPAVRYQYYRTADDRVVLLQASERKFWRNFCTAVGRPDLFEAKPGQAAGDHARGDEALRAELAAIFRTRTRAEWIELFIARDVPGGPVYTADELLEDPHFRARELLFAQDHPVAGHVRLFGTPVKVDGERFAATPAPAPGEHTAEVLGGTLGLSAAEIERLRAEGVV